MRSGEHGAPAYRRLPPPTSRFPLPMTEAPLTELAAALGAKRISSVELTQLFLDRIARHQPPLNAFITVDPDRSLAQARAADARIARGERAPLTGIPVAHKDIFCTRGWLTTCAS